MAAQIPCEHCIYCHTQAAKQHGATEEQIKEALASGALVRKWSLMLNGSQYDMKTWRQQVDAMFAEQWRHRAHGAPRAATALFLPGRCR